MRRMLPDTAYFTGEFVSEFIFIIDVLFVLDLKTKLLVKWLFEFCSLLDVAVLVVRRFGGSYFHLQAWWEF